MTTNSNKINNFLIPTLNMNNLIHLFITKTSEKKTVFIVIKSTEGEIVISQCSWVLRVLISNLCLLNSVLLSPISIARDF